MTKRLTIEVSHDIGDIVYLITDEKQQKFMVLSYVVQEHSIMYAIHNSSYGIYNAYDYELSIEKEIM